VRCELRDEGLDEAFRPARDERHLGFANDNPSNGRNAVMGRLTGDMLPVLRPLESLVMAPETIRPARSWLLVRLEIDLVSVTRYDFDTYVRTVRRIHKFLNTFSIVLIISGPAGIGGLLATKDGEGAGR
jgi:hypothetical protein